ncbi:MAG: tetratricopeptide repeat protein [Breznakibacter sp.]
MNRNVFVFLFWSLSTCLFAQVNINYVLDNARVASGFEDYVLSIQYFNRVINAKPYLAEPYYYRADSKYRLDDLKGAEEDCTKALDINPFMVDVYNLRGIIRLKNENYIAALDDFSAGLKVESENINLLMNRGIVYINLKQYSEAIADYQHVLKYDTRQSGAYLNMGVAQVQMGDTISALANFSKVVELSPYMPEGYAYRGILYYETKAYEPALADYNRVIELKPKEASYFLNRAIIRYQLDDLRGAFADIDRVIELDPRNAMAYSNRGILRAQVGDINRAIDDFSRVLAFDPQDLMTVFNRGLLYIQTGEYQNALRDLNEVAQAYPDFGPVYYHRSVVKEKLKDATGAQRDYMTAYKLDQDRKAKGLKADLADAGDAKKEEKEEGKAKEKQTRRKSDKDIRKYNQVAVLDDFEESDVEVPKEQETIRGRIQNRDIVIDLEPMFGLSFYTADTLLPRARYFEPSVEAFNQKKIYSKKLRLTNRELNSTAANFMYYFDRIHFVTDEIKQDPGEMELHFVRGVLYSLVLNYNNAIADFDVCLKNNSRDINAMFNRAYVRYKMVEAIRNMEQSAPVKPVEVNLNLKPGVTGNVIRKEPVVEKIVDYDLIVDDLERIVALDPQFEFAYYNLGIVYCQKRDFAKAEELFTQAIGINGDFAEAYFNRGLVRLYLEKKAEGTFDLSKSGELGMYRAYNVIKRFGATEQENDGE